MTDLHETAGRQPGLTPKTAVVILSLLAFTPAITALLSWDFDGKLDAFQYALRNGGYVSVCVELGIVTYAIFKGMNPFRILLSLSSLQRRALWLIVSAVALSAASAVLATELWIATFTWGVHALFFTSAAFLIQKKCFPTENQFWKFFLLGTLSYIALIVVFANTVPNPLAFPWSLRLPGVTNVRHTSYIIAPALAVTVAYCLASRATTSRTFLLATLAITTCFACWSGSRGILFALICTSAIALVLYPAFRNLRKWALILTVMCASALVSMTIPTPNTDFGIVNRVVQVRPGANKDLTSGRIAIWSKTLSAIKHSPIFGYGVGRFREVTSGKIGSFNHPHNLILQIVFQWGFLGAFGFFFLLIEGCSRCLKSAQSRPETAPTLCVLVTLLSYSMIDGTGHYPFPIAISLIAMSFLLAGTSKTGSVPLPRTELRSVLPSESEQSQTRV